MRRVEIPIDRLDRVLERAIESGVAELRNRSVVEVGRTAFVDLLEGAPEAEGRLKASLTPTVGAPAPAESRTAPIVASTVAEYDTVVDGYSIARGSLFLTFAAQHSGPREEIEPYAKPTIEQLDGEPALERAVDAAVAKIRKEFRR